MIKQKKMEPGSLISWSHSTNPWPPTSGLVRERKMNFHLFNHWCFFVFCNVQSNLIWSAKTLSRQILGKWKLANPQIQLGDPPKLCLRSGMDSISWHVSVVRGQSFSPCLLPQGWWDRFWKDGDQSYLIFFGCGTEWLWVAACSQTCFPSHLKTNLSRGWGSWVLHLTCLPAVLWEFAFPRHSICKKSLQCSSAPRGAAHT